MSGFISISRKMFKHDFWTERRVFSRAEAWLDLIRRANWEDATRLIGNTTFFVKRGELIASEREMANWWGWSQKRVQNFIKLGVAENMISIEKESVGSRIILLKYDSYNSVRNQEGNGLGKEHGEGTAEKGISKESARNQLNGSKSASYKGNGIERESAKNQEGISRESAKNQEGISNDIKLNNKQEEKEKQEKQPLAQAGGFDFEKLANAVGRTCAKLLMEGEVGKHLEEGKRKLLRQWLSYRNQKGSPITTTTELFEILEEFKANDLKDLTAACKKSYKAGWKVMVIEKPKDEKTSFPNYWQPGIEAKESMTPEQTIRYHQSLMALGWYKTTEQGQPYWNRPQKNGSRTGETTLASAINGN